MSQKSQPVIVTMSVLAGLQFLAAGSALADIIPANIAAFFALAVAATQVGVQFYVKSQVVPLEDVTTFRAANGTMLEGGLGSPERGQP